MATSYGQHVVIVAFSSEENHSIRISHLRFDCLFFWTFEMFLICPHSSRIQVGLLQLLAFILALIISKKNIQSIFLGWEAGTAKKASAVGGQNCNLRKSVGT